MAGGRGSGTVTPIAAAFGRRRERANAARSASAADTFRARLDDLEGLVDRALAESGAPEPTESGVAAALDSLLSGYARLGRAVSESPVARLVGQVVPSGPIPQVDDFGFDREYEDSVAPVFRALYRHWWHVEVAGVENIPAEGPVLLVANHAGGLFPYDAAMLKVALYDAHHASRSLRPLVDDFVYRWPFVGDFMTRCGGVRGSVENAERLLRDGEAVVVFPEGSEGMGKPFGRRYRLERFGRGDFVRMALRGGAPVVPVSVVGSEEIHPVIGKWDWMARQIGAPYFPLTPTFPWLGALGLVPLPSRWRIEFGEPVDWPGHGPEAASDRLLVSRLSEDVRSRLQHMLVGALKRRGPAFF